MGVCADVIQRAENGKRLTHVQVKGMSDKA
jgi:hypothetical protein